MSANFSPNQCFGFSALRPLMRPSLALFCLVAVSLPSCSNPTATAPTSPSPVASASPSPTLSASPSPTLSASPTPAASSPSASPAAEGNKTEATKSIEASIISTLSEKSPSPIKAANCPNLEKLEGGKEFDCTLTIAEGTFPATVTLNDSSGKFAVKTKNILVMSALESQLVSKIKQDNKVDVKADCGSSKVKLFKNIGESFECKLAKADGKSGTATVTVTTATGGVDAKWSIEQ